MKIKIIFILFCVDIYFEFLDVRHTIEKKEKKRFIETKSESDRTFLFLWFFFFKVAG